MSDTPENKITIASRNSDTPENKATIAPTNADSKIAPRKNPKVKLTGLFIIYLFLFVSTGYFALMSKDRELAFERHEQVAGINDQETKTFVIDALKQEDAERLKRQDLAIHSFNVVLGALLGFLSASVTILVGGQSDA